MSKSTLKSYLADATTSLGLEEFTDGEQKLDVIVSSEPSVDQVVTEMVEAKIVQDEISRDCDALVEAQCAMESYAALLSAATNEGGIDGHSAAFLRVGLERYEDLFGLSEPLTPSVEAFGGSASKQHATTVSLEKLSETLKKGWEIIKKALAALWNALKDVYAKATGAATRLERRAKELEVKAAKLIGTDAPDAKITIRGASKLFADGENLAGDIKPIAGFVAFANKVYPETILRYVADVAGAVGSYDPARGKDAAFTGLTSKILSIGDVVARFSEFKAASASDRRFGRDVYVVRSEVLPGNQALYISAPQRDGASMEEKIRKLGGSLNAQMLVDTGAKAAPESVEVEVKGPAQLKNTAAEIARTAAAVVRGADNADKVKKAVDELIKAGDALKERADKAELSSEHQQQVDAVLRGLVSVQKLLGTSINGMLSYSVSALNVQLAVVERQLAAYPSSESKAVVPA